jgi:hypothetical protein
MYCKYSKYITKSVFEQFLNCSLTGNCCLKQKFCHKQNKVIHTDDWEKCPRLVREEKKYENIQKQK